MRYLSEAIRKAGIAAFVLATLASCSSFDTEAPQSMTSNPVSYFEIPVSDMDRAIEFYEAVFLVALERTTIDGHDMALFPFNESGTGISGALAKGQSYEPSSSGPRLYFYVKNIDEILNRAIGNGGKVAYEKTLVGPFWVAEFVDSEGNQIALSSPNE